MNQLLLFYAALAGLATGSFLNVVIYRLPLGRSVVRPRSSCPGCGRPIPWNENIPVASYLFLKGRCRKCKMRISPRYPAVELAGMALAVVAVLRFGFGVDALFAYAFLMALLAITFIDWEHRIIPDQISLSFILLGIAWSVLSPRITLQSSALGAFAGGGGLWLTGAVYKLIRKTEGMGGGDVKLMAMIGAFLGINLVLPVIIIASFFGSLYGLYLVKKGGRGKTAVAFGSFLAPAAAVCVLYGPRILDWYFGRF